MFKLLLNIFVIFTAFGLFIIPQDGRATGEISIMLEDSVEFSNLQPAALGAEKAHTIGPIPPDSVLFFNLFCEGNAGAVGGTENVTNQVPLTMDSGGGGTMSFDMTICDFCTCADLEGEAFNECHAATESCATFNNAIFVFDPIITDDVMPDPDFPDAVRVLFTMTDHDPPINCTGKFKDLCEQNRLDLTHHCTHLFDSMGNIVKSVDSAYIFSTIE